ncbi:MAG: nucleoside deaminase [bacterium]|nr:nucleoside deaminase [bacterium]
MEFAISLAERNVAEGTGGPFGAAIFDLDSGDLIAAGVNVVVAATMAIAHAEIVAIAMAGVATGHFDLANSSRAELVTTTEPCAMCLGAVPWSGVTSLVCGARDEDARAVGFDEGIKPTDWMADLDAAGISVTRDIQRSHAADVLADYARGGGVIYNGRGGMGD